MKQHLGRTFSVSPRPVLLLLTILPLSHAADQGYVGRDVCAGCHVNIARTQITTNMARTWQGVSTPLLPPNYLEKHAEGPAPQIQYQLKRTGQQMQYQMQLPGHPAQQFPVEALVGGRRHGISFLVRIPTLEGSPLPISRLIEARYFHSAGQDRLAFSLGFPEDKPTTYETAFGRVLTPYLEKRCLGCHVAPRTLGTHVETGVSCENCHGPGVPHLAALGKQSHLPVHEGEARDLGILNPDKLPPADRMQPCSQCHAGSSSLADPMPDDVLISDQVTALKNSECWRQSGGQFGCTNCHNPHQDASGPVLVARAEKTCLSCHSEKITNHAGLCPVNRVTGCIPCHMANEVRGAFTIAEHWIRVHPEQQVKVPPPNPAWRTTVAPSHLYLREIALDDRAKASDIRQQLASGGSFLDLARANSVDRASAVDGGYLGDVKASDLDPASSASILKLDPGEISGVIEAKGKYLVLQRMPRTFRVDAEDVFNKAMELRKQGKQQESIVELLAALKLYPHLLRALTWLGAAYGEAGNPGVSAGILNIAVRLYPNDAGAHFNLGMAYGATGNDNEISEYKRTIEIDPDYVPAYLNWGGALFTKGKYDDAIELYRQGLNVNPLNAPLHYSLSLALEQANEKDEAAAELKLAAKIDPKYAQH